jgi:CRP-like cAMP-binding protein
MAVRRQLLDVGEWLRGTTLFRDLSQPEAAVLATFLDRIEIEEGAVVLRQGNLGDDVFLIEAGTVEVKLTTPDGRYLKARDLGPRDYFGEIALIAGGERTADVIATTPRTLLRLTRDAYERYLARLVEVERDLTKTALARSTYTLRTHRPGGGA